MAWNALLTRIRRRVSKVIEPIAVFIARSGVKPNYLTLTSLILSLLAFTSLYYLGMIHAYIVLVLFSGLMDVLDGAVARLTRQVSKFGAFLDSTLDRLSDYLIIYPLVKLGFSQELVVYLIIVSLLISYVRARGESLGLKIEGVGLIERAERLLLVLLVVLTYLINSFLSFLIFILLIVLSTITLIQRIWYVAGELR